MGERRPLTLAQIGVTLDPDDLPEVAEVEHARLVVDLVVGQIEPLDQTFAHPRLDVGPDLEPDHLAEAPAPELVLDRREQVVGLVGDVEVGVARDPEEVVGDDLHAGEERVEMAGDDVLERHERRRWRSRRTAAAPPSAP